MPSSGAAGGAQRKLCTLALLQGPRCRAPRWKHLLPRMLHLGPTSPSTAHARTWTVGVVLQQPWEVSRLRGHFASQRKRWTLRGPVNDPGFHSVLVRVKEQQPDFLPELGQSPMVRKQTLVSSYHSTLCNLLNHSGTRFLHL